MTTEGQDVEQPAVSPITSSDAPRQHGPEGSLTDALLALRDTVDAARFDLGLPDAKEAARSAQRLVAQLDDYVLPRLRHLDAPLLAVAGGSTGAGKSTLVNSLVRTVVSPAGVLRPTTRSPVLVCHPDDAAWFTETHVLPGLTRTTGAAGNHHTLHLAPSLALTAGLAFLDSPDIDSVVEANRDLANQLLGAADLWLFVTTAARYADAVPWDLLNLAQERSTALAIILNRVPAGAGPEVTQHLREMLAEHGIDSPTLFVLPEIPLEAGLLPEQAVGPLQVWLTGLADSAEQRAAVVRQTLDGALTSLWPRAVELADASEAQADAAEELRGVARSAYAAAVSRVHTGIADGALLRGEVLARWQEFVGTGDLLRALENRVGRMRDRLTAALSGRPPRGAQLKLALESGVAQLVISAAEQAAEDAATSWRSRPSGAALLRSAEDDLGRNSRALAGEVERLVREWQGSVLELVRSEGAAKRTAAKLTAYGVNATGLVVMVAVFVSTHLIPTGLEIAVAGGTTALSQKLLEAVFGDQAVRRLAETARADLLRRVETVIAAEEARYINVLDQVAPDPGLSAQLRACAMVAEAARKQMMDAAAARLADAEAEAERRAAEPGAAAAETGAGAAGADAEAAATAAAADAAPTPQAEQPEAGAAPGEPAAPPATPDQATAPPPAAEADVAEPAPETATDAEPAPEAATLSAPEIAAAPAPEAGAGAPKSGAPADAIEPSAGEQTDAESPAEPAPDAEADAPSPPAENQAPIKLRRPRSPRQRDPVGRPARKAAPTTAGASRSEKPGSTGKAPAAEPPAAPAPAGPAPAVAAPPGPKPAAPAPAVAAPPGPKPAAPAPAAPAPASSAPAGRDPAGRDPAGREPGAGKSAAGARSTAAKPPRKSAGGGAGRAKPVDDANTGRDGTGAERSADAAEEAAEEATR